MIGITANQFAMFSRLLLLGSIIGGVYCPVKLFANKKNAVFGIVVDVLCGILGGIALILTFIKTDFTPYGLYMPISLLVGFLMGNFILREVFAYLSEIVYNVRHKK